MSKARVWASNAMINPAMLRLITYSFPGHDREGSVDIGIPAGRKNRAGESLSEEDFPPEVYVRKGANTNYAKLPHLFFAGSYWIVSGEAAAVLRRFDLGQGGLYPTKVFRKDRKTPIGTEWYCLNFGNVKKAFIGERSRVARFGTGTTDRWNAPTILKDGQFVLTADALVGPDIWVDPHIFDIFFVSDALAMALKEAKVAVPFGLKRCVIA